MSETVIVSVVRNRTMYSECVAGNGCLAGCRLVALDNSEENVPIPVRYNSILEDCPDDVWIVFCHEDWKVMQNLPELLAGLNPEVIYGPIGVFVNTTGKCNVIETYGSVTECAKDGTEPKNIRGLKSNHRVDTLDCQCIIVHSTLVGKYGLRFDENLKFDMYAEDFCVSAYERHGIISESTEICCVHYSRGTLSGSFYESLEYMRRKYRDGKKLYASIAGYKSTFGKDDGKKVHRYHLPLSGSIGLLVRRLGASVNRSCTGKDTPAGKS